MYRIKFGDVIYFIYGQKKKFMNEFVLMIEMKYLCCFVY